jgi:hypothetical protein
MEEETNKFTNYKCETILQACTMQEVRICQKKLANGEELGKNTQEEEESVRDGMERDPCRVRSREEEHGYL